MQRIELYNSLPFNNSRDVILCVVQITLAVVVQLVSHQHIRTDGAATPCGGVSDARGRVLHHLRFRLCQFGRKGRYFAHRAAITRGISYQLL